MRRPIRQRTRFDHQVNNENIAGAAGRALHILIQIFCRDIRFKCGQASEVKKFINVAAVILSQK